RAAENFRNARAPLGHRVCPSRLARHRGYRRRPGCARVAAHGHGRTAVESGLRDLMLYYVNLDGREFPLTLRALSDTGPSQLESAGSELEVEVLSHPGSGRPALVLVDGAVYRVRTAARPPAATSRPEARRAFINGQPVAVSVENELERRARPNRNRAAAASSQIRAPM